MFLLQTPASDMQVATDSQVDDTVAERDDLDVIFEDIAAMVLPRRCALMHLCCLVVCLLTYFAGMTTRSPTLLRTLASLPTN
jgi:hypothetical protein